MVIIHFYGLDMFLVGELNEKIHSQVAKVFGISDEEVIFSASDSFVFFKGHEQTSFNLYIDVNCPVRYKQFEKDVAELLLKETENFSVHTRLLFNYYQENNYYERINENYPEFIVSDVEVALDNQEYDENKEYNDDELFLGNVFEKGKEEEKKDESNKPFTLNDFFKK